MAGPAMFFGFILSILLVYIENEIAGIASNDSNQRLISFILNFI